MRILIGVARNDSSGMTQRPPLAAAAARISRALAAALLLEAAAGGAMDYYVSPVGKDSGPGTREKPWRTLARASAAALRPGDRLLLQGGAVFRGTLSLDAEDSGTAELPVRVDSYGEGVATIDAGDGGAIRAYNCAGIEIRNLRLVGSGAETNAEAGLSFYTDLPGGAKLEHVIIERVEASGFGKEGLSIGSWHPSKSGFSRVRVADSSFHDNRLAGLASWGYFDAKSAAWSHRDIRVERCRFFRNKGDPAKADGHSGSGIVLGDVDGAVIERCEAFDNGELCNYPGGGPVGIWAWDSNRVVIQHCESHHNRTGRSSLDGGGFDLDGGTTNSIVQYCYSHDNDGAGFLLCQFEGARPFSGNTVRYCISLNDGRQHGYGGLHFYNAGGLRGADVYHNTVCTSPAGGNPAALVLASAVEGCRIANNILVASGGASLLRCADTGPGASFLGNVYWSSGGAFRIEWGRKTFGSLAEWRSETGRERLNESDAGVERDPHLESPGAGARPGDESVGVCRLRASSPIVGAGIDLRALGIDPGPRDFFGGELPRGLRPTPGAHEPVRAPR